MHMFGHWEFPYEFDISEWFGFIYRITEISTGKEYIGKRQFHQHLRKAVKGKKNKVKVLKEAKWKTYTSSSVNVNQAILDNGIDKYKFEIESLHKTRASLVYAEVRYQVIEDVLRARFLNGSRKYYNGIIASVRFIPPAETPEEALMKRKRLTLLT